MFWQEKIKIGNLLFPRFIGGPLDGITDSPFRRVVRRFSSEELLFTEMRHVACVANDKGAVKSVQFEQYERPLNYQFAANRLEFLERACTKVLEAGVDMVDLNVGCPAKNVIRSGSGSALMADLPRLKEIVTTMRRLIPLPFTVKIRAGFREKNAVEVAQLLQDCGVDALSIHPRLQTQHFEGRPDYELAAQVKRAVSIPVIISGGVVNWKTAQMVHEQTGVDGFLIGRGIWGRPWKLKELDEESKGNIFTIDNETVLSCALDHFDKMIEFYGPRGLFAYRKHLPFYVRGMAQAADIRRTLQVSQSAEEIKEGLIACLKG